MDLSQKIEILTAARQRISKPENFLQRRLTNFSGGYCAIGAITNANVTFFCDLPIHIQVQNAECCVELVKDLPLDAIEGPFHHRNVVNYNNCHSHAEVLAMFDTTIKRLKRELVIENLKNAKTILETKGEWKAVETV